jgi:RHH-type proline utilization regulon transcriptional repressor/proline dehydrogenase/delta 1-pyrroline-5-carboxylate dehydrogenase
MLSPSFPTLDNKRQSILDAYRLDEKICLERLLSEAQLDEEGERQVAAQASEWITEIRKQRLKSHGIDAFLSLYALSSEEGIALMCLAEALLRVPDKETVELLIRDKLTSPDWKMHLGKSDSFFVNAATWGLMLTGHFLQMDSKEEAGLWHSLKSFFSRSSEPVIRRSVEHAMRIMGKQFVMGETIEEALKRAEANEKIGYRYSYDMLGEAARTEEDALRYQEAYIQAIRAVGTVSKNLGPQKGPSISIKLSALHPRYELGKRERVLKELAPRLLELAQEAKAANCTLTVDAEEADRLDLSLDIIETVFLNKALDGWEGFGLAVQAYQKRAIYVLDWVADLAQRGNRRMMVRLIKGAYWDAEIKQAQMLGLKEFPVFTRRCHTDVSYQACVKKLLSYREFIFPAFATHNAYSAAFVLENIKRAQAEGPFDFEFQCLHGMGKDLYEQIVPADKLNIPCRVYAPVGSHKDLLPYLVRRLLENGANSSFVNQIVNADQPIEALVQSPVEKTKNLWDVPRKIPLPTDIFAPERKNSQGIDLSDWNSLKQLKEELAVWENHSWEAFPSGATTESFLLSQTIASPSCMEREIGRVFLSDDKHIERALDLAEKAYEDWNRKGAEFRANCLRKAAELLEKNHTELMALAMLEAGKTISDAIGEIREAVDFCYYYAHLAETQLAHPVLFKGYTGESNSLSLHGRGVMLCISPWNFPLAIFLGQVAACLAAGNTVIAKPAEQTPLIAARAVELLYEAGIPKDTVHLLPGDGAVVGPKLTADIRVQGVLFTGSTETAKSIAQTLAHRSGPIVPFVAETGGLNAMIVDSSALLEQVTQDVMISAFGSAGQRCSALRVLFVQEEVFDPLMRLLDGAMRELKIGEPTLIETDIGPVIDKDAQEMLLHHKNKMKNTATLITEVIVKNNIAEEGYFVAPCAFEISDLSMLKREVFGPILHVIRYERTNLADVIDSINQSGYGLTLGIHSRIGSTIDFIHSRVKVGNCYVNRSMIGAVVGLQPFGGEGLSGTGPKAGGPHYLQRLCVERTLTVNTTAAGGNALLMTTNNEEG